MKNIFYCRFLYSIFGERITWPDEYDVSSKGKDSINEVFSKLTEKQQNLLRLRFEEGLTVDEIAARNGSTKQLVKRMEARALRKLRHPNISRNLKQFLPVHNEG